MCRKLPIYNLCSAEQICDERNRFHYASGTAKPNFPLSPYFCETCHAWHLGKRFDPVISARYEPLLKGAPMPRANMINGSDGRRARSALRSLGYDVNAKRQLVRVVPGPAAADISKDWAMSVRTKDVPLEIKDTDGNTFTCYASTNGNRDRQDECVAPGAWTNCAEFSQRGWVLWNHDQLHPIADPVSAVQDSHGLLVTCAWHKTPEGQAARQIVHDRMSRGLDCAMSVGYKTNKSYQSVVDGKTCRVLTDLSLYEISLVVVPANVLATVVSSKSEKDISVDLQEALTVIRTKAGARNSAADKAIMRTIKTLLNQLCPDDDDTISIDDPDKAAVPNSNRAAGNVIPGQGAATADSRRRDDGKNYSGYNMRAWREHLETARRVEAILNAAEVREFKLYANDWDTAQGCRTNELDVRARREAVSVFDHPDNQARLLLVKSHEQFLSFARAREARENERQAAGLARRLGW